MVQPKSQLGFTFIELLVAVTVMLVITGSGIVAFIRFNQRQVLISAGKELQTFMRSAKVKAASQEVPAGCATKLWAYRVSIPTTVAAAVNMYARCGVDKGNASHSNVMPARDSFQLPAGVSLAAAGTYDIDFYTHHGGVAVRLGAVVVNPPVADVVLTDSGGSTFAFTVTQGGEITEGVYTQ